MNGQCKMFSLGMGYNESSFASMKDLRMVLGLGTINLKPAVLQLFECIEDFNASMQH